MNWFLYDRDLRHKRATFFTSATFLEHSLLRTSYFFQVSLFIILSEASTKQLPLVNSSFIGGKPSRRATFSKDKHVQNKDIYRIPSFKMPLLLQSIKFFRKATFSSKALFRTATFWKQLFFQKSNNKQHLLSQESYFFRAVTFSKKLLFSHHNFPEKVFFHSISYFQLLPFLFIR